ncbi:MAG: PD-(D/E)XK nuclease family protein, partial [Lancefieldella rimae]
MAFTLTGTTSTSVISLPVREALLASIERCGRAVLLVDTLDTKKTVQKLLAADPVLSLGLTVSTLFEWTEELWRLFGNGRPLISGELRKLCIFEALESFEPCALDPLSIGAGVAQAVEQLTQGDLYCAQDQRTRSNLTAGEKRVLTVLDR